MALNRGIDYSKWDRMEFSSSGSEDEKDGPARVTRLDGPSRVTRQADGTVNIAPSSSEPATGNTATSSITTQKQDSTQEQINNWTRNGGIELDSTLYWCQDRNNVVLRYKLEKGVMGRDVRVVVEGALPYTERACAVATQKGATLFIKINGSNVLQGTLPHPIYLGEDEEEESQVDWMVEQCSLVGDTTTRLVVITLHKAVPMEGVTCWWRKILEHLPERRIEDGDDTTSGKQQRFQQAWDEAHKQFREKIQSKKSATDFDTEP